MAIDLSSVFISIDTKLYSEVCQLKIFNISILFNYQFLSDTSAMISLSREDIESRALLQNNEKLTSATYFPSRSDFALEAGFLPIAEA